MLFSPTRGQENLPRVGQRIKQKQSALCERFVSFEDVSGEGILLRSAELWNWNGCDSSSFWGEKHQPANPAQCEGLPYRTLETLAKSKASLDDTFFFSFLRRKNVIFWQKSFFTEPFPKQQNCSRGCWVISRGVWLRNTSFSRKWREIKEKPAQSKGRASASPKSWNTWAALSNPPQWSPAPEAAAELQTWLLANSLMETLSGDSVTERHQ